MSEWKIPDICRKCFYRRIIYDHGAGRFPEKNCRNFDRTYCAYPIIHNELRRCYPTNTHCEKFKER